MEEPTTSATAVADQTSATATASSSSSLATGNHNVPSDSSSLRLRTAVSSAAKLKNATANLSQSMPTDDGKKTATPVPLKEMKSKAIYDLAKTKMLASRARYRLSSETGFIKLRSKPPAKTTQPTGKSTASQSGVSASAQPPPPPPPAAKDTAVAGWKEKGLIDSGKKPAPTSSQPSMFDMLAQYVEILDRSGLWRNCAGVFGLLFLTYLLTTFNFGLVGLGVVAALGAQWYRNSITRYRRAVKDDLERAYERATITRTLESVGWMNEFITRFWLMFEPSLSRMVIDIATPILDQNCPGFLDSLNLTTFTLGTKAPRIDGVRTYSELEDRNQIVMDWHASFTPNDLSDVPPVLRENRVNPKVVLSVRVGKGFIGAGMPILVEDMVFRGKMQVKLNLGPVFPHVRTADVCFLERPTIDFSLKPVGGDTFGFDVAHMPGLRTFILDMIHSIMGPMFYAPNHFTIDVEQLISGAVANIPSAKGVLVIHVHSARGLPKMDAFGKADPYVKISTIKHPEISVKTDIIEKTLSPTWDKTLIMLVYSKTDTIKFEIFDWNKVGKDDKIGFVDFSMQRLLEQPESQGNSEKIMMGESERGHLSFDMSYFPVMVRSTQAAGVDAEGNPLDPSAEAANQQQDEEDAGDDSEEGLESNTGLVRVFVRSAMDLALNKKMARKLCVRAEAYIGKDRVIECPEVRNTDSPSWEVGKEIFVLDRERATIRLVLINTDTHRPIGTLKCKIDDAIRHQTGENGTDWYSLDGHVKGKVRLNVKWRPILMDPDVAANLGQGKKLPRPPIGFIKLTCHEGRSLKNVEAATGSKSDPYLRVMAQNQVKGKTRYIACSLDPVWNETLFLPVHTITETLALECMDWNRSERDKPLGEAMLRVKRLMGKQTKDENGDLVYVKTEPVEMWAGLRQRNGKTKGEIRFRAAFVPVINFDEMLTETERSRGMLEMKVNDGGLVLGEEEELAPEDDVASVSASSISSSDDEEERERKISSQRRKKQAKQGGGLTVGGAEPPAMANNAGNAPREDNMVPESMFSGMTGRSGGDGVAQALGRYPRLPNINYSQFSAGVLSIAAIGCRGLVRPFAGVFVNVYLNGNKQAPVLTTDTSRRRGREHMWEDELAQTAIAESKYDTLMLDLKCKPAGVDVDEGEMISIGHAEFPMSELLEKKLVNTPEPVWLPLDADTGEVLVLLRYDPVEDPELLPNESIADQGMVRIRISSASNLPAADKSGTSDPYVVALVDGVKVWESHTIKKTLNPKWNQQTEVGIRQRSKTVLTLEVYDWNQIQSHTLLGSCTIRLGDLPINEMVEKDYLMAPGKGMSSKGASMNLTFLFKPGYVEQHDDSSPVLLDVAQTVVKAPVTVIKGGASVVGNVVGGIFGKLGGSSKKKSKKEEELPEMDRKLSDVAAEAMKSATNMPLDEEQQGTANIPMPKLSEHMDAFPSSGMLAISIESAKLHKHSKKDLFVTLDMNHKNFHKTRVEKDATKVRWDSERYDLPILQGGTPEIAVALKDHHSGFFSDKVLAEYQVQLFDELREELLKSNGQQANKKLKLADDGCEIELQLEFTANDDISQQESSMDTASLRHQLRERHKRRGSAFSRKSQKQ